jgi:hypothetical protein
MILITSWTKEAAGYIEGDMQYGIVEEIHIQVSHV